MQTVLAYLWAAARPLLALLWPLLRPWLLERVTEAAVRLFLGGVFVRLRRSVEGTATPDDDAALDAVERAVDRDRLAAEMTAWVRGVLESV